MYIRSEGSKMKKNLIVLQEGNKDCGAATLLSIIRYYGGNISIERLIDMTKTTKEGTNFYNISVAASSLGLESRAYKIDDVEKIKELTVPYIVQFRNKNYHHFVVVYKVWNNKVLLMDPARGKTIIDLFDFNEKWTGYLLLFEKVRNLIIYPKEKVLNRILLYTLCRNKKLIFFLILLSLIFVTISSLVSLYAQIVFDQVIETDIKNLIVITIIFAVFYIVKNITNYTRNHLIIYLNQKLDTSITLSCFTKIILLPFSYYKNRTTGEVLSRIKDLSYIKNFISKVIVTLFLDIFAFILSFIILYNTNKKITFLILFMEIGYLIIIFLFIPYIRKATFISQEDNAKINNNIIEAVSSFETIKGLNIEDNTVLKFSKIYSTSINNNYQFAKINNLMIFFQEAIGDIIMFSVSFINLKYIMKGNLTIGSYTTITYLMTYLIYPLNNLISILNEYYYNKSALKRANSLFEIEDEKIYEERKLAVNGNIKIHNLNYTYNNKSYILKNLNLRIEDRERVLILGPSGCGKSTIMKLLYKYYPVDRDMIFINNYDINDYSLSDIRRDFIYVSQNELLYTDSIRNNILLDRQIKEERYLDMCKIFYVDDIIKGSMLGYDYLLEENGCNISGGQRQRIILARSLLKEGKIIMIDEGLSQIDINLERKILKNMFYYFYDQTIIIISHRQENMDLYDRVIRIEEGKTINLIKSDR